MPARKNSKKRQVILEALAATTAHPTAQELYQQLKPDYPDLRRKGKASARCTGT